MKPLDTDYSKYLTAKTRTLPEIPSSLLKKFRLLEYIVEYWVDHTRELEPALQAKLQNLVMNKTLSFMFRPWGTSQHYGPYGCSSCTNPKKAKELPFVSPFHYAAQVGQ